MRTKKCRDCNWIVSRRADKCPYCGASHPGIGLFTYIVNRFVRILLVVALIIGGTALFFSL